MPTVTDARDRAADIDLPHGVCRRPLTTSKDGGENCVWKRSNHHCLGATFLESEARMKDRWKQTSAWMAVLVAMFVVLLSFTGMLLFNVRAQHSGSGIVEILLEGAIVGALFYLWRQQATLRRREALAISKILEARNGYIREQLQLISLRYGNDPSILRGVSQIVQSLEIKLPGETKNGRAAA